MLCTIRHERTYLWPAQIQTRESWGRGEDDDEVVEGLPQTALFDVRVTELFSVSKGHSHHGFTKARIGGDGPSHTQLE